MVVSASGSRCAPSPPGACYPAGCDHLSVGRQIGVPSATGPQHRRPSGRRVCRCCCRSVSLDDLMTTHDRPFGRHFEDFVAGDVYKHWPGKTITEYDDHLFCMITMNHHPLHTNEWFAENETVQGKNVVVGNLVYSLVLGHERARRERRGHRQPRDRVAAPRQAHLPRRHDLRRHQGARGQGDVEGRPRHRHRGDQGHQPARRRGLLLPPQADGVEAGRTPRSGPSRTTTPSSPATTDPSVRTRTRRLLLGAGAVPVVFAVVLGVEVQLARSGPDLPDGTPLDHDGRLGGDGRGPAHGVARRLHRRRAWAPRAPDGAIPRRVARALRPSRGPHRRWPSPATGSSDVVDDQVGGLAALRPDVVLVSIGANDVVHLTSNDAFRDAYEAARRRRARRRAARASSACPTWALRPGFAQPLRAVAGLAGPAARPDLPARWPRTPARSTSTSPGRPGPRCGPTPVGCFAVDQYHPSDDGYALWADAVLRSLDPRSRRDRRSVR